MESTEKFCPGCGKEACMGHDPEIDPDTAAVLARHEQGDHEACHPAAVCAE